MCFICEEEEAARLSVFDRIFKMSQEASDGEPCLSADIYSTDDGWSTYGSGYTADGDTYSTDDVCWSGYSADGEDVCGPNADTISQVDNLRSLSMRIRCGVTQVQCMLLPCRHTCICYCEDCKYCEKLPALQADNDWNTSYICGIFPAYKHFFSGLMCVQTSKHHHSPFSL